MQGNYSPDLHDPSRRGFLKSSAALAASGAVGTLAQSDRTNSANESILAYVGTYSAQQGPEGSMGNGKGIYLFQMNPSTGALSQRELFADDSNPSWLAFDPSRTHLYAANETSMFQGTNSGSVSAFSIDRSTGHLTLLNTVSSQGAGPCHLSVHPSGKYVLVANYEGGTVAVLPIRSDGELGPASAVKKNAGKVGPAHATSAPPGSFAISGHDGPHAHMTESDPAGQFVLASDLGLDQILIWKLDVQKGTLSPNNPASVALPPGDGPRHFAFHHNGRWLYSLQEEASTLVFFDYDATSGALSAKQSVSTLPAGFTGTNFPSEVMVSPDGKFVYAANRLHDTIAIFSIGAAGALTYAGEVWTQGDYIRHFNIDPTGSFLYVCNQRSDAITTFRINLETGRLTFTGQYTPVGSPAAIIFLSV
jgi:6-phosphogluconolactonase